MDAQPHNPAPDAGFDIPPPPTRYAINNVVVQFPRKNRTVERWVLLVVGAMVGYWLAVGVELFLPR